MNLRQLLVIERSHHKKINREIDLITVGFSVT